jgi:hypothetical protein
MANDTIASVNPTDTRSRLPDPDSEVVTCWLLCDPGDDWVHSDDDDLSTLTSSRVNVMLSAKAVINCNQDARTTTPQSEDAE